MNPKNVLRGHGSDVSSVKFVKNQVVSSDHGGNVIFWDLEICRPKRQLFGIHDHAILHLDAFDSLLLSQGRDGIIRRSDLETGKLVGTWEWRELSFCRFGMDLNRGRIAFVHKEDDNQISLNDMKMDSPADSFSLKDKTERGKPMSLDISDNTLFVGFEEGSILGFDLRKSKIQHRLENIHKKKPILSLKVLEKIIFSGGAGSNLIASSCSKVLKTISLKMNGINEICCDKNRLFCSAGWDGHVRLFDSKRGFKPLAKLQYHSSSVNCVDLSRCENSNKTWKLLSGGKDRKIALWHIDFQKKKKK